MSTEPSLSRKNENESELEQSATRLGSDRLQPYFFSASKARKGEAASSLPASAHLPRCGCCSLLPGFKMKVIAAYLLAVLGGNVNPSPNDLKDILGAVGAEVDGDRIEFLLSEVKGKDITELIASGREKFASVPCGGGGVAVAAPAAAGSGGAAAPAAAESKKEEKVEEKEESDEDMGFSLFD